MGKVDTTKVSKRSLQAQELRDDKVWKSSIKKAKRKERNAGKKEIREALNENKKI